MKTLYRFTDKGNVGTTMDPKWIQLSRRLSRNVKTVTDYTRNNLSAVPSNHLLVSIMQSLNVDVTSWVHEYYNDVRNRAEGVAKAHGITSTSQLGTIKKEDGFYGESIDEIYIYAEEDIRINQIEAEWMDLSPIKVLMHPCNDLSLNTLDGRPRDAEGLAVVQIDIVLLMMQYYFWYHSRSESELEMLPTKMQFAWQYPLHNALHSHYDIAILNRYIAHVDQIKPSETNNVWPFYLNDYERDIDRHIDERLMYLYSKSMSYQEMMSNMYRIKESSTMWTMSWIPDVIITRQNKWIFTIATLPYLKMLLSIDRIAGGYSNTHEESLLRKYMRAIKSDRNISNVLPRQHKKSVINELETIMDWLI